MLGIVSSAECRWIKEVKIILYADRLLLTLISYGVLYKFTSILQIIRFPVSHAATRLHPLLARVDQVAI